MCIAAFSGAAFFFLVLCFTPFFAIYLKASLKI
jgi:hypothetical protein